MAVLRYHWPEDEMNPDGSLKESGSRMVGAGDTLYMSDQLGLHKVREITLALKVVGNEKEGGSRQWQMIGICLRPRPSRFVCIIILLLSLILCISVSAPVKQNE
jgi:hypothetical protein